ncbi:ABC transporter permease [Fervidibacillus halotolerans]|uniref:ABC transporter permease n=1 Tax=Fervidibacillus halotolerans TaxID=2980027 RepID=A0A9E8S1X3_9BACI|nr:ABC transporter permease [Fervidibacillus halotolerans]WAA13952.1 ABC transporter permease [Fervidibacillus halotolerans]
MNIKLLHDEYKKALIRKRRQVLFFQMLIFLLFFALWELSSRLKWIDPLIFSSPSKIWDLFLSFMTDGSLPSHISTTLFETILGFLIGTGAGVIFAAILWWSPFLSKVLDPYLVIFNAMPKVALGPIFIVILGPNMTSIITMGAIIAVIITTIVVYSSFRNVDPNYVKVLQTFGATRFQCFWEAILPSSFPTIISSLKVNVGLAWVGVIVGEFLVSKQGLGYLIIYGFQVFNFTLVLLSLLIIALFATLMYKGVEWLEKKLIKSNE